MKKMLFGALLAATAFSPVSAEIAVTGYPDVLNMQERSELRDTWLRERLDTVVPELMRARGVDMWVLIAREYNEDPVVKTMLPSTWLSARRRTVLVFYDNGEKVERLAISRYAVADMFPAAWNPEEQPDQWQRLSDIIAERDPKKIAINVSPDFALADGLTQSQYAGLMAGLTDAQKERIVMDPGMSVGWLERRIPAEMVKYQEVVQLAHAIIQEGFSNKVIVPGKTTVDDVRWWYRDKIRQQGVVAWFHPSVAIQRKDSEAAKYPEGDKVIRAGDLLWVDFGITYLGLNTDTQQHAYVLKPGETDAPEGLKKALATGNRLQDILTDNYKSGRSGNETLKLSRAQAIAEGIVPSIYTHPLGFHGHGAGATIGMWDNQNGTPVRGDYPVMPNTAWSIELNARVNVPEWDGQEVRIQLEEDAYFDGDKVTYINGRKKSFHLIKSD